MTDNNEQNNGSAINRNHYAESKGTGALSTIIFVILVTIGMVILAHFKGS
jgi:hypothetical protein